MTKQIETFLRHVLIEEGYGAVSYPQDYMEIIILHILNLFQTYPSFQPTVSNIYFPDYPGVVLQIDGVVPFDGYIYGIPIRIYIIPSYPLIAPLVDVSTMSGMTDVIPHPYVTHPGRYLHIPYLSNWEASTYNLVGLVQNIRQLFSHYPPLIIDYSWSGPSRRTDSAPLYQVMLQMNSEDRHRIMLRIPHIIGVEGLALDASNDQNIFVIGSMNPNEMLDTIEEMHGIRNVKIVFMLPVTD